MNKINIKSSLDRLIHFIKMSNLDNPRNVLGMGDLLADDDEDLDIEDLEKSIITGVSQTKKGPTVDLAKEYGKEIEDLGRKFGVRNTNVQERTINIPTLPKSAPVSDKSDIDDLLNWSPGGYSGQSSQSKPAVASQGYKAPYNLVDDDDDDTNDDADNTDTDVPTTYYPASNARPAGAEWSSNKPQDEQLNRMTNEERKQNHVNQVLGSMEKTDDDAEFVQQEDEEDEMARIMEQIDLLRSNLESEGVDLSRIPDVNTGTSKKEAKAVLRILQIKNDRLRYCDFFEEGILAIAYGLEGIFNGQREILGSRIDLTGYSDTVKVKLRRMRYDTSNFVSSIMQGYNISSGWRIALELIPSLFLYSRDRKLTAKDNLISDESYKKAMQDLQP